MEKNLSLILTITFIVIVSLLLCAFIYEKDNLKPENPLAASSGNESYTANTAGRSENKPEQNNPAEAVPVIKTAAKQNGSDNFTGSSDQGNYVYGAAMNLAWNEMKENILRGTPEFKTQRPDTLSLINKLNSSLFTTKDLDAKSYYVKSGFGQTTIDAINRESKQKFPDKSFSDLNFKLSAQNFITYAYFLKSVEYQQPFAYADVQFNNESVKGFSAHTMAQKSNIEIMSYTDENHFLVKLKLKDDSDEIFLAKGFDMDSPQYTVDQINLLNKNGLSPLGENDIFTMPEVHLDHQRNYMELQNIFFLNPGFENKSITTIYEKIKFDIDNMGAKAENEAAIVSWTVLTPQKEVAMERKLIVLDKPFWIMMKRADSRHPYFALGVNNSKILKK